MRNFIATIKKNESILFFIHKYGSMRVKFKSSIAFVLNLEVGNGFERIIKKWKKNVYKSILQYFEVYSDYDLKSDTIKTSWPIVKTHLE